MKKHIIYLAILGLLSFSAYGQEEPRDRKRDRKSKAERRADREKKQQERQESRSSNRSSNSESAKQQSIPMITDSTPFSIKMNEKGYAARACIIDGEVFSTNTHPYMETLCSLKGGKITTPKEARSVAIKANQIHKVCCSSQGKYSWVLTRGKAGKSSACTDGSSVSKDMRCFTTYAKIQNKPKGMTYEPGNNDYSATTLSKAIAEYSKNNRCGVAEADKSSNKTSKGFFSSVSDGLNDLAYKLTAGKQNLAAEDYTKSPKAPVCCLGGDGKASVVANKCVCDFKSSSDTPGEIVNSNRYQCPELNKILHEAPKEIEIKRDEAAISKAEEEILTNELMSFIGDNKECDVINRTTLPGNNICSQSKGLEFHLVDIACGDKIKSAICHERISTGTHPVSQLKSCHTEGKEHE